jgi:hypothetical protein
MSGKGMNRLFEGRVASSEDYAFNGETGGDKWRRKVKGYWTSKCLEIKPILEFAESIGCLEFTNNDLAREASSYRWMGELDVRRLSELIWGFLNSCLSGKALEEFEGAEILDGMDGWRRVVQRIYQGAVTRAGLLRKAVKNPPAILKLEDVPSGVTRFEGIMKAYKAAGGTPPVGHELKTDVLETLPWEVRELLMWRVNNMDEPMAAFTEHVGATSQNILFHSGEYPSSINATQTVEHQRGPCGQGRVGDGEWEPELRDELNAVMRRWGKTSGAPERPGGAGRGGGDRAPRTDSRGDLKCTNCGGPHRA